MACKILRNSNDKITEVLASNGQPSVLYKDLVKVVSDLKPAPDTYVNEALSKNLIRDLSPEEHALALWSKVYTPEFKQWFGDSKVVDKNGEPMLVYHRSKSVFDTFDKEKRGANTQFDIAGNFFFSDRLLDQFEFDYNNADLGNNIYPVFLSIDKLTDDTAWEPLSELTNETGRKIQNDDFTEYVVFEPNQIKSVFNVGQFGEADNIYYSKFLSKSYTSVPLDKTLKSLSDRFGIHVEKVFKTGVDWAGKFENGVVYINTARADETTAFHEFAHPFVETIKKEKPETYENLVNQIKTTKEGKAILREVIEKYPGLTKQDQIDEAIVETVARYSTGRLDTSTISFADSIINFLKELFGIMQKVLTYENPELKKKLLYSPTLNVKFLKLPEVLSLQDMANIMVYGGKIDTLYNRSDIVAKTRIANVNSYGGVYHGVGAYMNNANIKTVNQAIDNFIELFDNNQLLQLAAFTGRSNNMLGGAFYLSFHKEHRPTLSFTQDVGSRLTKNKERIVTGLKNKVIQNIDDRDYSAKYEEVFIDAYIGSVDAIYINKQRASEINLDKLKKLSDKLGVPIYIIESPSELVYAKYAQSRAWYTPRKKVEYVLAESPKYSKFTKEKQAVNPEELEKKLKGFLSKYSIDPVKLDNVLEREGMTVYGVADLLNKTVQYTDTSVLAEETAHIAVEMTDVSDSLLEQVSKTEMYRDEHDKYMEIYKDEQKVRKEILGKLIAQKVIQKNDRGINARLGKRLERLWNNFVSWLKGSKELTDYVEKISTAILEQQDIFVEGKGTGEYFSIEKNEFDNKEEELLYKGISSLKQRLSKLYEGQTGKGLLQNIRDQINILEQDLEQKQVEAGINKMLKFFNEDSLKALKYIDEVRQGNKKVDSNTISYIGEFVSYYYPVLTDLRRAMNNGDISKDKIDIVRKELANFEDIKDFYKDTYKSMASEFLGTEIQDIIHSDVNMAEYLFGSLRDVGDTVARRIHAIVSRILKEVEDTVYIIGKGLLNEFNEDFDTLKYRETIDGKKTHFFLTEYKLGQFYKEYDDFINKLNEKFGITKGMPIDRQKRIEYNQEKNKWLNENTERKFVSEYYDIFNSLSLETVLAKEAYDLEIRKLLLSVTTSDGYIEFDKLSEEQFEQLEQLEADRKGLSNLYYADGTKKAGTDLQIAEELKEAYDKLKGKLESEKITEKFLKLNSIKKKQLSDEEYKKWYKRVTQIEYDKEFYNMLENVGTTDYGLEYEQLKEERNELLKRYRNSELKVNVELIPESIKDRIFEIETQMSQIRKGKGAKEEGLYDFEEVAEVVTIPEYDIEWKKQHEKGNEEYLKWFQKNHVNGKPISIWTQIVPKDKKYIRVVPKKYWAETSEDSPWYNKNFNKNWRGMQPKDKWKNEQYNTLTDEEKVKLNRLIEIKNQGDLLYKTADRNFYMLPQMSKNTMDVFTSANRKDNLKELIAEGFTDRVDDDMFGEIEVRQDGSQIKYIPRFYIRPLDNPDFISDDLLRTVIKYRAAAEKYKKMGQLAPDMQLVLDAIQERRFVGKRKSLSGNETNAFKAIRGFIDHHMYGISTEPIGYLPVFGKNVNISKLLGKIEKYVRDKNLVFNLFTTLTAYTTASINSKIEDLVGTYTDNKSKMFAEKEYLRNVHEMLAETGKVNKQNKLSLIMERLGIEQDPFDNLDKSRLTRLATSVPYASYEVVGHRVRTKMALAVMYHYKIHEGKLVTQKKLNNDALWNSLPNLYEQFEIKDGIAKPSEQLEKLLPDLSLLIEFLNGRIDGQLSPTDKAAAHRHAIMQLLTTHRGWLWRGVQDRFKSKGINELTGEYEIGHYRAWWSFLRDTFMRPDRMRILKNMMEQWETLEDYEKLAVRRTLYEITMAVAVGVAATILNKIADDDDDDEYLIQLAAYVSNRTLLEMSVFPSIATGAWPIASIEMTAILNSPIAATSTLDNLSDILYIFSSEEIDRGTYEGLTKGEKALIKMTPGLRGFWNSRSASEANQFLKYKSLKWLY